jgi:mannitol PTS system EIICBA or EIICB component
VTGATEATQLFERTETMALPDALANKNTEGGARAHVQRFGGYLAGMIMPNISAFIAWGLITSLFLVPEGGAAACSAAHHSGCGWLPNDSLSEMIGPMITYLLPLLIGYTGGRMVHGQRGAVVGAIATMGVIVGSDVPMFLGAMIIGPLAGYLIKLVDNAIQEKVASGFEMLVDNFSAGIIGLVMAVVGKLVIGPPVDHLVNWAGDGVNWLVNHHVLPLASLIVEPAKVLFLNNAINHGVFTPLGSQQVLDHGKSILFMVESNPGPGAGLLLAYFFFGPKALRPSVPGALIIQFLGGIHEIYFPYVLMKPQLILATIAGGMSGLAVGNALHAGLVGPPAPGSIFAYIAETPRGFGNWVAVYSDVVVAAGVSFIVAAALMGFGRAARNEEAHLPEEEVLIGS